MADTPRVRPRQPGTRRVVLVGLLCAGLFAAAAILPLAQRPQSAGGHDSGQAGAQAGPGTTWAPGQHEASRSGARGRGGHGTHPAAVPAAGDGLRVAAGGYAIDPGTTRFQPGRAGRLTFRVVDRAGRPVTRFRPAHERLLHLIVVRRDLTGYQHLHPTLGPGGTWSIGLTLPKAGVYRAFADFVTDRGAQTLGLDLFAPGPFDPDDLPAPRTTAAAGGGYLAVLDARPGELVFRVTRWGRTVTDLEPYLGARGHLVILREGDLSYLHAHPNDAPTSGSSITFHAAFPGPASYRLFLQFQHRGQVRTAAFTVRAP